MSQSQYCNLFEVIIIVKRNEKKRKSPFSITKSAPHLILPCSLNASQMYSLSWNAQEILILLWKGDHLIHSHQNLNFDWYSAANLCNCCLRWIVRDVPLCGISFKVPPDVCYRLAGHVTMKAGFVSKDCCLVSHQWLENHWTGVCRL